jgi:hypothetical protein
VTLSLMVGSLRSPLILPIFLIVRERLRSGELLLAITYILDRVSLIIFWF